MKTLVISAFPACGKSWLAKHQSQLGYKVLELESSKYDKTEQCWEDKYVKDIKEYIANANK